MFFCGTLYPCALPILRKLMFFSLCLVFVPFLYYVTLRGGWSGQRFMQTSILPQSVGGTLLKVDGLAQTDFFYKGAFQQIPKSRRNQSFLGMTQFRNVKHCLFANNLLIVTLHYDDFDRLTIEPSGCRAPIFKHKMRSRKGSVKTTVQFVDELLPRSDI